MSDARSRRRASAVRTLPHSPTEAGVSRPQAPTDARRPERASSGRRPQRMRLPGMRSEAASALVAACERAAGDPCAGYSRPPGRGPSSRPGGTVERLLGVAQRLVGPGIGVAFERCEGGIPDRRTGPLGANWQPGPPRLRRKSWCLRFERAHDHTTRVHRASALQELRGIAGVSASRPLFIPS